MLKKIIITSTIGLTLLLFAVLVAALSAKNWFTADIAIAEHHRILEVERGQSVSRIATHLSHQNIIAHPRLWVLFSRVFNLTAVKQGEYVLSDHESPLSILEKLNAGQVKSYSITFAEGIAFNQWLAKLESRSNIENDIDFSASGVWRELGFDFDHPEGWFFPDSYHYIKGDRAIDILKRAHKKMKHELADAWVNRAEALPYTSSYDALIMASIVERETGVPEERDEIAGVFVRRLQKKMRLQTDPTVIYGMGEHYNGNITRKDLKTSTPYNTYVIRGLPPTPIAMPGRDAIIAALNPKAGTSLYFVAKGDGSHQFSDTLAEHNKAVREYQLKRKKNYRSTVN